LSGLVVEHTVHMYLSIHLKMSRKFGQQISFPNSFHG
jgi:hypothetical protein